MGIKDILSQIEIVQKRCGDLLHEYNETIGPIILFYQKMFWTQGLALGKPHPSPFVNSYILPNRSLSIQVL